MKRGFTLLWLILLVSICHAQNCSPGSAYTELDINNVQAGLRVAGDMWWDGSVGQYIVPKVEPGFAEVSAIFAGGLWIGGLDPAGNLKLAYSQYRNSSDSDYFPGPLDELGQITNEACADWDRFFKVDRSEIEAHIADFADNGMIDEERPSIYQWPGKDSDQFETAAGFELPSGQSLAPYFDIDGDGIYEPADGEYPSIKGDQAVWWVFNDAGNVHSASQADQMNLEVHVMAYAIASEMHSLDHSTFYEYEIVNKGFESIRDFRLGLWVDPDLGCHLDDFLGYDASRDMTYVYNSDAQDLNTGTSCTGGVNTYGSEIPMLAFSMLSSSFDDSQSGLMYLNNASFGGPSATFDPSIGQEAYNILNNRWLDGTPLTGGGDGYNIGSQDTVNHVFPGAPDDPTGWSMCSEGLVGRDIRFIMTNTLPDLQPGQRISFTYLVLTTEPVALPCPSLDQLMTSFDEVKAEFDNITSTDAPRFDPIASFTLMPNPSTGAVSLQLNEASLGLVKVYNSIGGLIHSVEMSTLSDEISISLADQPDGLYFVSFTDSKKKSATSIVVLQR